MSLTLPPIAPGHDHGAGTTLPAPADWDISHVGFGDVMEALNPLQYLPGVGMIYREVTGDSVHPALRIAVASVASLVFGGPIGLAATLIGAAVTEVANDPTPPTAAHAQASDAYRRTGRATA